MDNCVDTGVDKFGNAEIEMMNIKGKKVLIVGFGRSGQAAARYCLEHGAQVTVTDKRLATDFDLPTCRPADLSTYFGSHPLHIFEEADIIIPSPGVPLTLEGLVKAKKLGIPVIGEMELVVNEFKAPIIAITGTNGKSTVTTLIGEILKESGKNVLVGGNLGIPLIEMLATCRPTDLPTDFIVLEVSSYQLEITPSFHPYIALLLNITPDHLDRYANFEEYISVKELIIKNQHPTDFIIYNEEDELVAEIAMRSKAKKIGFSFKREPSIDISRALVTGLHNKENMLAAICTAEVLGCKTAFVQKTIENFKGLPHRNQFVREVSGVKYFDDSKGTNVGAVQRSLEGFDSKVVLIAGGLDKGGSYEPLKPLIKDKVRALVLIGTAKGLMKKEFKGLTKIIEADSMAAAVREAAAIALAGDIVLLSPACASFDMFKDYADRGNKFAQEVMKL